MYQALYEAQGYEYAGFLGMKEPWRQAMLFHQLSCSCNSLPDSHL